MMRRRRSDQDDPASSTLRHALGQRSRHRCRRSEVQLRGTQDNLGALDHLTLGAGVANTGDEICTIETCVFVLSQHKLNCGLGVHQVELSCGSNPSSLFNSFFCRKKSL